MRRRRRVLALAYHFPPLGGGGVQRNAKFVRYLPDHGYDPIVITGPGGASDRWTPADATLGDQIPSDVQVLRVAGPEPEISSGRRAALERRLMIASPFGRWWTAGAVELARGVGEVDLVYGSLVPYESAEAAVEIARLLGKPWVADLQDPWALDEMWLYPTALHRRRDLRRMRRVLGTAAAVVMNTPEAARRLVGAFPELRDRLVVSITNGFDADDYAAEPPERDHETFRIAHTGYLHTNDGLRLRRVRRLRRALGGMAAPVDILPRSHVYLLRAIRRLLEATPELEPSIELVLAGVLNDVDREVADGASFVRMPGYLSHRDAVSLLQSSELVFLPMHDLPSGMRAGLVPGKTYEYLATRRPILAAVPDGDARDLLDEAGSAFLTRPTDTEGMERILREQIERWRRGNPPPEPREEVLERYERRRLTATLAELFDRVIGLERR